MQVNLLNKDQTARLGEEVNVKILLERNHDEDTLSPVHSLYFPTVSFFSFKFSVGKRGRLVGCNWRHSIKSNLINQENLLYKELSCPT